MIPYAELQVTSNFSFLRGASHPHELVAASAALGHQAIALTDRNSLAGVVRAHDAARQAGIRFVVGARLDLDDAPSFLCFPADRAAYGRLTRLITVGRRRAPNAQCRLMLDDLLTHQEGQVLVTLPPEKPDAAFARTLKDLRARLDGPLYLAAQHLYRGGDAARIASLAELADECGLALVATNDVHYHVPSRRVLQDVLTCIREHCTIDQAGFRLMANAERYLKSPDDMARLFARWPDAVARTVEIAARCRFELSELRYEYPVDPCPPGLTPQDYLERESQAGARRRYLLGVPDKVAKQLAHELDLVGRLGYAPYFLTVYDIVRFACSKEILCQGRGSAANSAICYCLGITAVDPAKSDLLFERFVSAERDEPPDIDVDFEHERREEVIQYIYGKYGREHAGIAATVITYRRRSAIRDVGKALGLSLDMVGALAETVWGMSLDKIPEDQVRALGLDPGAPRLRLALDLAGELLGFPRHLSQHVGGFVITKSPLSEVVPIANAAMAERTFVEWDKDDLDTLGILKIDVLSLGMLTAIRKAFELVERHHGRRLEIASVPQDDVATYDMLCKADSIGVFQVESRAQMSFLPRMKPRCFYDLVIEVAIVRPGPIQGDMVHPYLRRRNKEEKVEFPSAELEEVLGKTLGVPLFQEQAMRIAIVAAGFTPGEADHLRRAMATFRKAGTIGTFRTKMIEGMVARRYDRGFAERCFSQIEGFGEYGFPESHAASFALLAYVSAWLKCHYPAAFACALLNSQPMGFYAPAQIVRDAKEHGVEIRPVDVNHSLWDCTLEPAASLTGSVALRLGFRQIKGFAEDDAKNLVAGRSNAYADPHALWRRAGIGVAALERLATADALASMGLQRREALWALKGLGEAPPPLFARDDPLAREPTVALPAMSLGEAVSADYTTLRLSLKSHPLALLRDGLTTRGVATAVRLAELANGARVRVAGLVLVRQRPGSAKGVIFVTLEDETGVANVIIWPKVFERFRREAMGAALMIVTGRLQHEDIVTHIVADRLEDRSTELRAIATSRETAITHDFAAVVESRRDRRFPSRDFR
ncbi:MAG: error-prone DNA polymerase [Alphaproteobacteria bacterium]|nr:error-prone DNA polymerase [Alphaproteobacteria bacterium]